MHCKNSWPHLICRVVGPFLGVFTTKMWQIDHFVKCKQNDGSVAQTAHK